MKQTPMKAIQGYELDQLRNCVRVAMTTFADDAKMFRNAGQHTLASAHKVEKRVKKVVAATTRATSVPVPLITESGAARLAEQFEHQAKQAGELYDQLQQAEKVLLVVDPE